MFFYLLGLEWQKFKKNPNLVFLTFGFLISMPLAAMVGEKVSSSLSNLPFKPSSMFEFPQLWNWMGYFGNWLAFFFLGVMAIYLITTEVQYKTQRQNILNGLDRKEYFFAKLASILIIAICATLYYIVCTLVTGFLTVDNFGSFMDGSFWAIARFFMMVLGYMIFGLFVAFIIRRSGISVFFYLSYVIIIEPLIRWGFHEKIISNASINWYPLNAIEDLMPMPYYEYSEMIPKEAVNFDFLLSHQFALILTVIYSLVFLITSFVRFNQKDM